MKAFADFIPLFLFFLCYKFFDIYVATAAAMGVTALQVFYQWARYRRVEPMQWLMLLLIGVMGGATLFFHDEVFIKWKPSLVYWLMGSTLLINHYISDKPLVQRVLATNEVDLPQGIWRRLNISWAVFFLIMGGVNAWVAHQFDTNTWVNFKFFGALGLTFVFVLAQAVYLSRYVSEES